VVSDADTAGSSILIDVSKLIAAYYRGRPDPSVPAEIIELEMAGEHLERDEPRESPALWFGVLHLQ
jgi:hypothetical protein